MNDNTEEICCYDCETPVDAGLDRGFLLDEEHILCFNCSIRRGGRYASDEDRWLAKPQVDDIPAEEHSQA